MIVETKLKNLPVNIFMENNIRKYKGEDSIRFMDFLDKYLENDAFFVVEDKVGKVKYYIDIESSVGIKEILGSIKNNPNKRDISLDEASSSLITKKELIEEDGRMNGVIEIFQKRKQEFIPVIDNEGYLLGRISKKTINECSKYLI